MDGGCLLHKVKWMPRGSYHDVLEQYAHYVFSHYGNDVVIVFDGYCNGASTKDQEHEMCNSDST